MRRGYADVPEGQMHYVTEGSGQPLLLLHMTPRSWTFYRRVIPLLAKSRRVIALDTLGFGNSDLPPTGYGIPNYAESIVHFMDAMQIEKTDLWGSLTGSTLALEVAATWPERVRRLILMGLPAFLTPEEGARRIAEAKAQAYFTPMADGSHLKVIWEWALGRKVSEVRAHNGHSVDLEYMADWTVDALKAGPRFTEMALKVYSHDPWPRLQLVKAPTLLIGLGGKDISPYNKADRSVKAAGLIPNCKLVLMDGADADREATYARADDLAALATPFLNGEG